ncbi:MAG: hypothetical protein RL227_1023 [Pseudomonadota bacterium]|jgi:uncharacterized protein YceH (UPF0502 family)/acyl-CoA thioesterase FadM
MRELNGVEARVLAVLVEKAATVPDTYPLSLNSLVAGCNQKTARQPVMDLGEAEVLMALDELKRLHLVVEVSGSRVVRFEHNMGRVLGLPSQSVALLAVLMLRGPQTAAELRLNAERLHRFADISSVEGFLDELAGKEPARVVKLARVTGEREARWTQLLTGASPFGLSLSKPVIAGEGPSTGSGRAEAGGASPSTGSGRTEAGAAGLRFVLPEGVRQVHQMVIPLRWGDMDAMGHINNTLYFRYMETCRLDWVFSVGVDPKVSTEGPVMINAFCNFLRQLEFPGDIRITMSAGHPGRSSFDTCHTIERVDEPGVVYAEGGARMVWTDYAAKRSAPMPDWFRARLTE